tara:strand:- start:2505 stop:3068 length:564 start_codon:yes stop_codon:yes gene_type:complete
MLTDEQWAKIDKKYGNLMYKISHQISGDRAIANFDDNLQDIRLAAMEAVAGFEKQNGGANGKFEEFWGSKGFDQYIKTCLWTKKNNKGAKITKKAPILKGTVSTDKEEILHLEDTSYDANFPLFLEELGYCLDPAQHRLIDLVTKDPTYIKPSGKLNVKRLGEKLELSWFETNKLVTAISEALENEL